MHRRHTLGLVLAALAAPTTVLAAPSASRRLENRLDLWSNYARRTNNLLARLTTTRETSLLDEPMITIGTLAFKAPGTLVLREDGLTGSTTLIERGRLHVVPNQKTLPRGVDYELDRLPGARWLSQQLLRIFGGPTTAALREHARISAPRGRGYRLEILPPAGGVERREVRSLVMDLDPVAGAVTKIVIMEAQGDRVVLQLSDPRQNIEPGDIERILERARKLISS